MWIFDDPGPWILVALVACVHLTVWFVGRDHTKLRMRELSRASTVLLALAGIWWFQMNSGGSLFVPIVICVCGICGSFVASTVGSRFSWPTIIGAMMGVVLLLAWQASAANSVEFMADGEQWQGADGRPLDRPTLQAQDDSSRHPEWNNDSIAKAGYLDEPRFNRLGLTEEPGPYTRSLPVPLWHSRITGLYGRRHEYYKFWIPAGKLSESLGNARLVEFPSVPQHREAVRVAF